MNTGNAASDADRPWAELTRRLEPQGGVPSWQDVSTVLAEGVALLASLARAETVALFLVGDREVLRETWHPAPAAEHPYLAPEFRRWALGEEAQEVSRLSSEAPDEMQARRFASALSTDHRAVLVVAWRSIGEDEIRVRAALVPELLRLLSGPIVAVHRIAALEAQRSQYERWFRTLDQQLRHLDRERQKLSALVNQSDLFVLVADASGTLRWANRAFATAFAPLQKDSDWLGQSCRTLCSRLGDHVSDGGCAECPLQRAFERNEACHHEFRQVKDGAVRNFYLTAIPIRGPDGLPHEVLVMLQDLTDLRVLRRSESRYRQLFERSANAIVMVRPTTGHIVLANSMATRLLGYSPPELTRLTLRDLHAPEDGDRVESFYAGLATEPHADGLECHLRGQDELPRTAIAYATRLDLEGEEVVMVEFLDITERRRAQQALWQREEQLRQSQKIEAAGRLAGGMAHDFNNLLAVIQGRCELMRRRILAGDPMEKDAEEIHAASQRGIWLTRQLLAFSRHEVASPQILDLGMLVREMDGMIRSLIGEAIELMIVPETGTTLVLADRSQLEQVLLNLVINARDAMPHGGLLTIEVAGVEWNADEGRARGELAAGPFAMLAVRDDGFGMDEEARGRIFEPFFTTKDRGKGSGLGLSIVHGIVTQGGGHIEVSSEPGHGTTVKVFLPRVHAEASEPAEAAPADRPARETILLVEDDDAVRAVAFEALESEGYRVIQARRGHEALAIAERHVERLDLLITDVVMPEMGGGELAQRLTELRPELRVLFMSGYADDDAVRRGVRDFGAPFLQKPFSLDRFHRKVRELLDAPTSVQASAPGPTHPAGDRAAARFRVSGKTPRS